MAQVKELLDQEELAEIKVLKEELVEEVTNGNGTKNELKPWIWVAAIIAAIIILK